MEGDLAGEGTEPREAGPDAPVREPRRPPAWALPPRWGAGTEEAAASRDLSEAINSPGSN